MEFVINEWYLDWHRPDEPPENQEKVRKILAWLQTSEHRITILRGSPFHKKLNLYSSRIGDPMVMLLKVFFGTIFNDPARCRILEEPPPLPENIEEKLRIGNFASDRYLFQSAESTEERIIVTTDVRLINHFEGNGRYQLWTVEAFMTNLQI